MEATKRLLVPDDSVDRSGPEGLSIGKLNEALEVVRGRISDIKIKIHELDVVLRSAEAEGQLLAQLIALRSGGVSLGPTMDETALSRPASSARAARVSKSPALAAVVRLLEDAKRPLHISELMRLLQERAVPIPGAGRQANLIAILRADGRIVRPSRGMYGLRCWGLEDAIVRRARKGKRRRTARKEASSRSGPA